LKCSPNPTTQNIKVQEILAELELEQVKDIQFGNTSEKHCLTKGEKKRLSIAVELITNPALIFMDEPTTSMDTFTAEKIIHIINKLKMKGRTIIATIHQPNTEIFANFDYLMLLSQGYVIYNVYL
jgi:ABC-type multidrug transport system ATPase subunit